MTIYQLSEQARRFPVFSLEDCRKWFPNISRGTLILELSQYVRRGYFIRLKRGLYLLKNEHLLNQSVIASRLNLNSIISLETALHNAGLIPEIPFATTAVTSNKTAKFKVPKLGLFLFRHLKSELMFGWELKKFPPYDVKIAFPEKALLDLFWFHRFERDPKSYIKELRLSIPKHFSWTRFNKYVRLFKDQRINIMAKIIAQNHKQ